MKRWSRVIREAIEFAKELVVCNYVNWGFHNLEHFWEVVEAAYQLGSRALRQGKITERELELLMVAAAFHDVVLGVGVRENERLSAARADKWMADWGGFTVKERRLVTKLIMATAYYFDDRGRMCQMAMKKRCLLAKMMADADLANMGEVWEVFEMRVRGLWQERGKTDEREMWEEEKKFLEDRKYLTDYAKLWSDNLDQNRRRINDILAKNYGVLELVK